jgi:hypothetical protein
LGQSLLTLHDRFVMLQCPPFTGQSALELHVVVVPLQYLRPVQSAEDEHCLVVWMLQVPKIVGQSVAAVLGVQAALVRLQVPTCVPGGHVVWYVHCPSGSGLVLQPGGFQADVQLEGGGGTVTRLVQVCGPW